MVYYVNHRGALRSTKPEGLSVISWVNNDKEWNNTLLSTLHPIMRQMWDPPDVEFIKIDPDDGARSIAEAYQLGLERAKYDLKFYAHQDMAVLDHSFFPKIRAFFSVSGIAAAGFIGSKVDTGASWMHCPIWATVGQRVLGKEHIGIPSSERVALVDAYGLISSSDFEWDVTSGYEGPHMAVEDYCYALRYAGAEVWTIDSSSIHNSDGYVDEAYWRSTEILRRKWGHMMGDVPSVDALRDLWAAQCAEEAAFRG